MQRNRTSAVVREKWTVHNCGGIVLLHVKQRRGEPDLRACHRTSLGNQVVRMYQFYSRPGKDLEKTLSFENGRYETLENQKMFKR